MASSASIRYVVPSLLALLAGCAGPQSAAPGPSQSLPQTTNAQSASRSFNRANLRPVPEPFARNFGRHVLSVSNGGWASPDFGSITAALYLGDNANNTVNVYQLNGTPLASLNPAGFSFPWAIAEANLNNLKRVYVGNSNLTITVFMLGQINNTPALTLTQPACCPLGMTFDSNGNLYAGEFPSNVIDRWTYPNLTPATQVSDPNLASVYFLAADKLGNLFADGFTTSSVVEVDESSNGGVTWTPLPISGISFPGGLEVDKNKNLVISDQGGMLYTYAPPGYGPAPSSSFLYANGTSRISYTAIAFRKPEARLFAANLGMDAAGVGFGNEQPNKYPAWNILPGATPQVSNAMPLGVEAVVSDPQ
jgi:hypothetical protein